MTRVDEILAIIDTGLQTAGDMAYGDDWPGTCWRCGKEVDTDLCDECRAVLLDEDAADSKPNKLSTGATIAVLLTLDGPAFQAAIDALVASHGQLSPDVLRRVLDDHIHISGTLRRSNDLTNQGATSECSTSPTPT